MKVTRCNHATYLLTLLALFLLCSASVQAALEPVEGTFELQAEQILRWPLRAGDSLVVRPCHACDVKSLQVTAETRYFTGFRTTAESLAELLRQKSLLRNGTEHLVVVFFRPSDLQVTRIILQTEF